MAGRSHPFAGRDVEVSTSYVSDEVVQGNDVVVDDVAVSTGEGSTSFDDHGDVLDGWAASGAPACSPVNENDWIVGTVADLPPSTAARSSRNLSPGSRRPSTSSPSRSAGTRSLRPVTLSTICREWDSPWRTRPGRSICGPFSPIRFPVTTWWRTKLARHWFGDSVSVQRWKDIWLNEGFATHAQWLWSEHEGLGTTQQNFDFFYSLVPAEKPFCGW